MERKSFVFYKSFYECIRGLKPEAQLEVFNAICSYEFYQKEIEFKEPISKAVFTLMKPQLDSLNAKYLNGCKGGRPKKEKTQK